MKSKTALASHFCYRNVFQRIAGSRRLPHLAPRFPIPDRGFSLKIYT